jgi:hypothetical protein
MRSEVEVTEDLRKVRARRLSLFPTQAGRSNEESPRPAGQPPERPGDQPERPSHQPERLSHQPGGGVNENTDLLEMEARLVVERADIRRLEGIPTTAADQEEEATARRILRRLAETARERSPERST